MTRVADPVTRRLVGAGGHSGSTLSSRLREGRADLLRTIFPDFESMVVLDVGGEADFWRRSLIRPAHVTLVNPKAQSVEEPWMTIVEGDGCALPRGMPEADLAFSNSVIEHVGGHYRRGSMAHEIRTAAPRDWVQTPYRYFPVEPHFLFPGLQFLPPRARASVLVRWPLGAFGRFHERERAIRAALRVELLTATEMQLYFPDAELHRERFAGLTKSLIAVRR
jgi:hypothetical protein